MRVFIDAWGWITLYNKREKRHKEIKDWFWNFQSQQCIMYTTDYVLDEAFTLIFRRTPFELAKGAMKEIEKSIETGYLIFERITSERFEKAKELRLKYQDKPLISFTDFTSAVVMTEKEIDTILAEDEHFTYLETGFRKVP